MKIATLILNCLTAMFSVPAMIGTFIYCQYGQFTFFFTESRDPIFKIGELLSIGEIFLACVSLALGLISFFWFLKNKKALYLIVQLLLFPYNAALYIAGFFCYNYFTVRTYFWTGTFYFPLSIVGIMLSIVTVIFAIITFKQECPAARHLI